MAEDDRITGLVGYSGMKIPVRAATTGNIALTGLQTVDGIVLAADDRVLVKSQTDNTENGIYIADTGDWNRSADCDGLYDLKKGSLVYITNGTVNAGTLYSCTAVGTFDTDPTTFAVVSAALLGVSVYMQSLLDDTSASEARTTLGVPAIAAALNPDFTALTDEPLPDAADLLPLRDVSAGTTDKLTLSNFFKVIATLTGLTAPAIDDSLAIYDLSATSGKKIAISDLWTVISTFTQDTTPDIAADFLATYDVSAGAAKKVLLNDVNNLKKLASGAVAAAATLDIVLTTYYSIYRNLLLVLDNFQPVTDDVEGWLRTSTDGGSTYSAAAGNYDHQYTGMGGATATTNGSISDTQIVIAGGVAGARAPGNTAAEAACINVFLHQLDEAVFQKKIHGLCVFTDSADNTSFGTFSGARLASTDVDAIRIMFESGNINVGNWAIYGLRN